MHFDLKVKSLSNVCHQARIKLEEEIAALEWWKHIQTQRNGTSVVSAHGIIRQGLTYEFKQAMLDMNALFKEFPKRKPLHDSIRGSCSPSARVWQDFKVCRTFRLLNICE